MHTLTLQGNSNWEIAQSELSSRNFEIQGTYLDTLLYGLPQSRKRFYVVGLRRAGDVQFDLLQQWRHSTACSLRDGAPHAIMQNGKKDSVQHAGHVLVNLHKIQRSLVIDQQSALYLRQALSSQRNPLPSSFLRWCLLRQRHVPKNPSWCFVYGGVA